MSKKCRSWTLQTHSRCRSNISRHWRRLHALSTVESLAKKRKKNEAKSSPLPARSLDFLRQTEGAERLQLGLGHTVRYRRPLSVCQLLFGLRPFASASPQLQAKLDPARCATYSDTLPPLVAPSHAFLDCPIVAMASFLLVFLTNAIASPTDPALTLREGLSGALGSISLACWIFLLLPQLIENYRNGSAEAISLAFIFVWFIGDICNLAGALWAGLVPTVIAIAVYFCIADGVLIGQCLYYQIKNKRKQGRDVLRVDSIVDAVTENEPLLGRRRTESLTIPGSASRRRSSAASRRRSSISREDPLVRILEESDESGARLWVKNIFSILAIVAVGSVGWAIAYESGVWKPSSEKHASDGKSMATGAQILGYLSAVAYLGARIPQIIKNYQERSCEGMLPIFFFKA